MGYKVGVDIGGTFTDFVVIEDGGEINLWKEDSTPDDPMAAVEKGLNAISENLGLTLDGFMGSTHAFVHGSTIATNSLIVRNGGPVGLVCTEGFRDVVYFRDGFKPERFNVRLKRPADFVDRYLRIGVSERVNAEGNVLKPLDEAQVLAAAERFKEAGVKAVAVAFLWSVLNPEHEDRAVELLTEALPGIAVLASHRVLPEIREWERTSATVLSAYVLPRIGDYLRRFEAFLENAGLPQPAQYMQINGGCASVDEIMLRPVNTLGSGPAAAPAAAKHHASSVVDEQETEEDLITVDMGGTSFDVCLIRGGRPTMSRSIQVEFQPIGVSGVEVKSIGAGGGSIGWIDSGGALKVGPNSAGAKPGPACYDAGGDEPTVTDANVVLGYLSPEAFLGGRRNLRADLSEKAIETHVGEPLGLGVLEAAAGMIEVVNANMVGGIRSVSVERGIDPRSYLLVSGGGAGGLHATRLARMLGIKRVLLPAEASTLCAFGMTVTDVRHDYAFSHHCTSADIDVTALDSPFAELETEARARLERDGFSGDSILLERSVDARYKNQLHELTVPIPSASAYSDEDLQAMVANFHAHHEGQYTYSLDTAAVEFLHWRLTAIGLKGSLPAPPDRGSSDAAAGAIGQRRAYFPEFGEPVLTDVYDIEKLGAGAEISGPAILESRTTTVVINPGDNLTIRAGGSLLVELDLD